MIIIFVGAIGLIMILVNLFLLEIGWVRGRSKNYLLISFFGSLLLTWYSWLIGSVIFVALNSVFVLLSLFWLLKLHR